MEATRRKRVIIGSSIVIAALCVSTLLIVASTQATASRLEGYSLSDNTTPDAPIEYPVNENGYTYGASSNSLTEPALIKAVASNGKAGYVFQKELYDADPGHSVKSPEEAGIYMEEQRARSSDALYAALTTTLGEGVITREQSDTFKKLILDGTPRNYRQDADEAGLPTSLSEEDLADIVEKAQAEVSISVPVYESDGETVIGEFMIDTLT